MSDDKSELIVFDFDNTLIETKVLISVHNSSFEEFGLSALSEAQWLAEWGKSFKDMLASFFPQFNKEELEKFYLFLISRSGQVKIPAIVGGPEAIVHLRSRFLLGILTSRREFLEKRLRDAGYNKDHFEFCFGIKDYEKPKPHRKATEPIIRWVSENRVNNWCYVGDDSVDLEFTKNAGIQFLAVTTGMTTRDDFLAHGQPEELIFNSIAQLPEYFGIIR